MVQTINKKNQCSLRVVYAHLKVQINFFSWCKRSDNSVMYYAKFTFLVVRLLLHYSLVNLHNDLSSINNKLYTLD